MLKPDVSSASRVLWFTGYEVERYTSFSELFLTMIEENREEVDKLREI